MPDSNGNSELAEGKCRSVRELRGDMCGSEMENGLRLLEWGKNTSVLTSFSKNHHYYSKSFTMIQNYNKSYEICYPSGTKIEKYKHNHICDGGEGTESLSLSDTLCQCAHSFSFVFLCQLKKNSVF